MNKIFARYLAPHVLGVRNISSLAKRQVEKTVGKNQLPGAFTADARWRMMRHVKPIDFKLGATVCEAGALSTHACFPEGCGLSLLIELEKGSEIECANIGREGAFGLFPAMYSLARVMGAN